MSKERRVHELAKELGYANQELVTKINGMELGFRVSNVMTKLSEDEVARVKRALKGSGAASSNGAKAPKKRKKKAPAAAAAAAPAPSEPAKESVGPVIRRQRKRRTLSVNESNEPSVAVEASEPAAPTVRKRPSRAKEEEVKPVAEVAAAPAVAEPAAPAPVEPAPVKEEPKPEPVEVPEQPVAEVEAKPEPAPAPEVVAEVAKPAEPEVVAEPVKEESEPEPTRARVVSRPEPAPAPSRQVAEPAPAPEAARRAEKPKKPAAGGSGARVLGRIELNTMKDRIGERNFEVPGKGGKDSRRGDRRKKHGSGEQDNEREGRGGRGGRRGRQVRDVGSFYGGGRRGKKSKVKAKKTEITTAAEHKRVVRIEDAITVGELGRQMGVKAGHIALKLMELGLVANVNTTLDYETAQLVADEFGYTVENVAFDIANFYDTVPDPEESQILRPPVVTVMGHVDHGKTSLLDAIRSSSVTTSEAGGITQHIGAYTVQTELGGQITFLDTPGHEAFTALRARGAQATDIVILVVAADDGVMPQTVEAINHSREAGVPIVVAVNKIDKASANPDRIKQALVEYSLQPEEWGGSTQYVEVSALRGTNIDELLEQLSLLAEVSEFKANPDRDAQGIVIESQLDVGRGPLATMLVQRGTLRTGDIVVIGQHYGRVRTMSDHFGQVVEIAGPSIPVEITGLSGVPDAGEPFFVVKEEKDAKMITAHVAEQARQKRMAQLAANNMHRLQQTLHGDGDHKRLKIIVKGDVQGSLEALRQAFNKVGNDEVSVEVIHAAVGSVTENDVNLAASSDDAVIIIGFNVRPDPRAHETAEKYGIQIFTYSIIYDAIDQVKSLAEGMLSPIETINIIGQAEVRETFRAPKVGTIAGCYVTSGMLRRNAKARLYRDGKLIYESTLGSLRRFKDDVKEVKSGFECGTSVDNYNDIKIGDVIEAYEILEIAAKLN